MIETLLPICSIFFVLQYKLRKSSGIKGYEHEDETHVENLEDNDVFEGTHSFLDRAKFESIVAQYRESQLNECIKDVLHELI